VNQQDQPLKACIRVHSKLQTLCGVDVTESFIADFDDDHSVTDLYSIFQDLMPNLDTLRDMHLPETNLKCALALLALDPNEFRKINSTMIHYHDFPNLAIRAIQQEIKDSTVSNGSGRRGCIFDASAMWTLL
jgi:hypothetical protein